MGRHDRTAAVRLTGKVVEDNARLAQVVDQVIQDDIELAHNVLDVADAQARLRSGVGTEAWEAYLCTDELTTARFADATVVVARWAFEQGRRQGRTR
jgi:hypothetical protein